MEKWQIEHITNNLTDLLNTTLCDSLLIASLISQKVLCNQDMASLRTHANSFDRCLSLYNIVQTRIDGYDGIMEALKRTGQNGALAILQNGIEKNDTKSEKKGDSDDEETDLTKKWDSFILTHKLIFFAKSSSLPAISDLTQRFYKEEMNTHLGDHKFNSPNVLSALHKQVSDTMLEVYAKRAEEEQIEHAPIQEMLADTFQTYKSNYHLALNGNLNFNEGPAIGIDLGTCNLCTAVFVQGKLKIFVNSLGEKTTPSYVSFEEDGSMTIGKMARMHVYENPQFTVYDSKRMMGRTFDDPILVEDRNHWKFKVIGDENVPKIVGRDTSYKPEDISAILLKECKQQAERDLNQKVTKAVITVPAYFNNTQREATKIAGQKAGLQILQILNEPTAAAITYRQERYYDTAKIVLIFDIGGGTFDVAVVRINGEEILIKAIGGNAHLGGEDFDRIIMKYCIEEFERTNNLSIANLKDEDMDESLSTLRLQCEDAKKHLSSTDNVKISVRHFAGRKNLNVKLQRSKFEELCHSKFEGMINEVDFVLKEKNVRKEDIEDVILVGGSTRIPKLQEMLQEYFQGKPLNNSIYQDYAVAYGAAVQAAISNGEEVKKLLNIESIVDVIPMSIGIQCIKDGFPGQFSKIIDKNTSYPASYTHTYVTHKDNQESASIRVFQGEQPNVSDNFFVGRFLFKGIPKAPRGKESFDVCMKIDKMGILNVTASCKGIVGKKDLTVTLLDSNGFKYNANSRGSSVDFEEPM